MRSYSFFKPSFGLCGGASIITLTLALLVSGCNKGSRVPAPSLPERKKTSAAVPGIRETDGFIVQPDSHAIRETLNGRRTAASALWWGFNQFDVTENLRAAIRSGARRLTVPSVGRAWNVSAPLFLESHQEIVLEDGVIIAATDGGFRGKFESVLTAFDKDSITIRGYGAAVVMRKKEYEEPPYTGSEFRHCVWLLGCTNVSIAGVRLANSGGDGIVIERGEHLNYCDRVHIKDVTCDSNYRQGISVISARNLVVENTVMSNTTGTRPEAGIDFEPNFADDVLENCIVRHCTFFGNHGYGVQFWLENLTGGSTPVSISIEDSHIVDNELGALYISGVGKEGGGRGSITLAQNVFEGRKVVDSFPSMEIVFR